MNERQGILSTWPKSPVPWECTWAWPLPEPYSPQRSILGPWGNMLSYWVSCHWSGKQMSALSAGDNRPSLARGSRAGRWSGCHLGSTHVVTDLPTWRTLSQVWGRSFQINSTSLPSHSSSFLYKCFLAETWMKARGWQMCKTVKKQ